MSIEYNLVVSVPVDLNGFIFNQVDLSSQETDAYLLNNHASARVLSGAAFYYLPLATKNYPLSSPGESTIMNGGFENGPDGSWIEESSNDLVLILDDFLPTTITPHTGDWAVWMGGSEEEQAAISQKVLVPSGKSLSFWYWSASEETNCGADVATVMVNQAVISEINLCASADTDHWTKRTLDLNAYAGTTINLKFYIQTNGSLNSNLFLDDVSID
jgi:hypothetical protein